MSEFGVGADVQQIPLLALVMITVLLWVRPTPVIPGIPVNFLKAATSDVHAQQSVLTLSANSRPLAQAKNTVGQNMCAAHPS
jgi:hypothetical protein